MLDSTSATRLASHGTTPGPTIRHSRFRPLTQWRRSHPASRRARTVEWLPYPPTSTQLREAHDPPEYGTSDRPSPLQIVFSSAGSFTADLPKHSHQIEKPNQHENRTKQKDSKRSQQSQARLVALAQPVRDFSSARR